ncbi:hypothetical protein MHJ86_06305 [Corynebacterium afermentans]|nr:hypothetical protein [Corynebacterium afermentans]
MAERFDPVIEAAPKPFGLKDSAEWVTVSGLPEGTVYEIHDQNRGSGIKQDGLLVQPAWGARYEELLLQIFPKEHASKENNPYSKGKNSNKVRFHVTYPDGSEEIYTHNFVVYPAQRYVHNPHLYSNLVDTNSWNSLTFSDLPSGTTVVPMDVPNGWEAQSAVTSLDVKPSKAGNAEIVVRFDYSDGSSELSTLQLQARSVTPETAQPPSSATETLAPTKTPAISQTPKQDSGSSTGAIIAIVIGLLGLIGGIGAVLVSNPQLQAALPF